MVENVRKTIGLCVPLKQAENMRIFLLKNNLSRKDLKLDKDTKFMYFPVKKNIPYDQLAISYNYNIIERNFSVKISEIKKDYKEGIKLPKELKTLLPTSYDVVGDIALIKLPDGLHKFKKKIGEALIQSNKNIKTVCRDNGITGELRVRKVEVVAGENRMTTTHREHGLVFDVDVGKTYFSPRLAGERKRVADLVNNNEVIVDMFTGIAPFSIMIAKYAKPRIVYAIDKNKDAVLFARKNIKKNNVLDKVEIICGDAHDIVKRLCKKNITADRVIMNLPFSAHQFFSDALSIIIDRGIIHYYDILNEKDIDSRINLLEKIAEKSGASLRIKNLRKIKTYSPREIYIGADIEVKLIDTPT